MNQQQLEIMKTRKGFIAALDQSGGSTPKALELYGITPAEYTSEAEMFTLVHAMRSRIMQSPVFTHEHILGAILFERTMDSLVDGMYSADYLWEKKQIVPFLKIDKGLAAAHHGVQLMKPMPELDELLQRAVSRHIFGTKMRSVIQEPDEKGIQEVIDQQFEIALQIFSAGLVPIIEPEIDIHCPEKIQAERSMLHAVESHLAKLDKSVEVIFKFTIPSVPDMYKPLMGNSHVVRIVALSGGYSRDEANSVLAKNSGLIASFSRALLEGLYAQQDDDTFNAILSASIHSIYEASIT